MIKWYLGWSKKKNLISRTISHLDRMQVGEDYLPSAFSHVFWVFQIDNGPKFIFESEGGSGVRIVPASHLRMSKEVTDAIALPMHFSQVQSVALYKACEARHGNGYDWRHIFGLLLWIKVWGRSEKKRPKFLNLALNGRYICSEYVEATAREVGIDLCTNADGETLCTPQTATPESLFVVQFDQPSVVIRPCQHHLKIK